MKRNLFIGVLSAEALLCALFCVVRASASGVFTAVMAFPLEQIGLGLRALSLPGGPGNAAAIAIYIVLCLLPAAALLVLRRKRKLCAEDGLAVLLSAVLFAVLYMMTNPGEIGALTNGAVSQPIGKAILGGMTYSVIFGYFILRVLRLFHNGGTPKLVRYMSVMLVLINVLFVYMIFGACFNGLLDSIASLRAGNAGNEHLLGASYVFLVLQFIVDALPYAFNVMIIFAALRLLEEMRENRYSDGTVAAAGRVSSLCAAALVTTVLADIIFNLLQLAFAKSLHVINGSLQIPVFSIAFVLAALLFTRLITENKQLKDDNDLFI